MTLQFPVKWQTEDLSPLFFTARCWNRNFLKLEAAGNCDWIMNNTVFTFCQGLFALHLFLHLLHLFSLCWTTPLSPTVLLHPQSLSDGAGSSDQLMLYFTGGWSLYCGVRTRSESLPLSLHTDLCLCQSSHLYFTSGWFRWLQKITNGRLLFLWPDSMFDSLNWAAVLCCSSNGTLLWKRCWVILFLQSGPLCMKQKAVITNPEMTVLVNQKEWIGKYPQAWIWLRHMCSVDFRW